MKANATASVPLGSAETFVHQGINDRWRDTFTAACEEMALRKLGPECAEWLKTGRSG